MKKIIIIAVVILAILIILPFALSKMETKTDKNMNQKEDTMMQDEPVATTSEAAIDAYLNSADTVPTGDNMDDGSYESIQQ